MAIKHASGTGVTAITDTAQHLIEVVVKSQSGEALHLWPREASSLQEQISQLRCICQGPRCAELCGALPSALARHVIGPSGVAAWPMCLRDGQRPIGVGGLWVETQTGNQAPLRLAPQEIPVVARALTRVVLAYLHDGRPGGEDAFNQ